INDEWKFVAIVIDRLCLWLFLIVCVLTTWDWPLLTRRPFSSSVRISASSVNLPSDWRVLCEPAVSAGSASGRTTAGSPGQVTFLVIHDNLFLLTLNTYSARYE
ncbi:Neuronal acetylcholine receptor subunit beta-4, partial [Branchiostoma belcheri]